MAGSIEDPRFQPIDEYGAPVMGAVAAKVVWTVNGAGNFDRVRVPAKGCFRSVLAWDDDRNCFVWCHLRTIDGELEKQRDDRAGRFGEREKKEGEGS